MHRFPVRASVASALTRAFAAALVASLFALAAGASQQGAMIFDPKAPFEKYRTYAFAQDPQDELAPGAEGSGSPFIERQIQRDIRYYLAERGYDQASLANADFLIAIDVGGRTTTWYSVDLRVYRDPYQAYFTQWGSAGGISLHTFQEGRVMIDLIDGTSHKLVWHGWGTEPIAPSKSTDEIIKDVVKKVLDNFPPGSKKP